MKKNLSSKRSGFQPGINLFYVLQFSLLFLFSFNSVKAQVHLVKDINQNSEIENNEFGSLTDVGGTLYFISKQRELWQTDGTESGSVMLREFQSISTLKNVGGTLFFFADDGTGSALWKRNGSTNSIQKIKGPLLGSSLLDINGTLFFIGNNAGKGTEVWRSDGTAAGTFLIKDIMKGVGSSNPTSLVNYNNKLFFVANNGTYGYEIWESDGTTEGTHLFKDIIPGKKSSAPNYLTVAGNTLFFMARDAALGQEVWKSDGTPEGTVIVKDIYPGSGSSFPSTFVSAGENIFFRANKGKNNFQLWKSDGTAEGTIQLTTDGYSWINGLMAIDNYLYYILGRRLYRTDGTVAGTQMICEIEDFYNSKEMTVMNGSLYIMGTDYYSNDLWRIDGLSASVVKQASSFESGGALKSWLTTSGNNLYYVGNGGNDKVLSLWKSDGTPEGTVSFLDLFNTTQSSYPYSLTDVNGKLYFNAYDGSNTGLWKSDGTESGTLKVADVYASEMINFNGTLFFKSYTQVYKSDGTGAGTVPVSTKYVYPEHLTVVGNTLFFKGDIYPRGYELWKTNGTDAGTIEVKDIYSGPGSSNPDYLTNVNGLLYFSANDGITGIELWKSDGTESGTVRVRDIYPGSASGSPQKLTAYNGEIYFVASTPDYGYELWKSNGTESGTTQLKDINTGDVSILDIDNLKVSSGLLYFTAVDAVSGWALWRTDGTSEGTIKLKDFYPGTEIIRFVNSLNGELYMIVSDQQSKNPQLWKTNGTEAGTVLIKTIGVEISANNLMSGVRNGALYFNILNKENETVWYSGQAWVTNGTTCGTFKISSQSSIDQLGFSGATIFGVGYIDSVGIELLRIDESEIVSPSCPSVESTRSVTLEDDFKSAVTVTYYPNPFQKSFLLNVKGKENAIYSVTAMNINGAALESLHDLKCNVDYSLGANWNSGLYLLKIQLDNKIITKKLIKVN